MANPTSTKQVFSSVLKQSLLLVAAIAIVGGILGWVFAGSLGLAAALIGAGLAFVFGALTALSVYLGGQLSLGGFFGVVLGGWIFKLIGFVVLIATLKGVIVGEAKPVLFFTLVASILGTLVIDSLVVLRSRISIGEN
jgi:hypothetical protein